MLWIITAILGASALKGPQLSVNKLNIQRLGTYESGVFDESATEIIAYSKKEKRIYVTNSYNDSVDCINARHMKKLDLSFSIDLSEHGSPNSVAISDGLLAIAVEAPVKQEPGFVLLYTLDGGFLKKLEVGALPDMLTFTPDGSRILVAIEGEPSDDYTVDPEGAVAIIDLDLSEPTAMTQENVRIANFHAYDSISTSELFWWGIRVFGPGATASQDFEPEYITVSSDSKTAWIALQENNALAILDIESGEITDVVGLGFKDHDSIYTQLDASDKDGGINIRRWPVRGLYQPDSIVSYEVDGETYIVTANEGDARDYEGYSEEARVKDVTLSEELLQRWGEDLQDDTKLGRLKITTAHGANEDGVFETLYSYGGRSFSIWSAKGELVWDSGTDFAEISAAVDPRIFNLDDSRSDDKGGEPEALAIGKLGDQTYAFVGLERSSAILVYDITNPRSPFFVTFFSLWDPETETGELAPESILFIPGSRNKATLIVASEVSGTVSTFRIKTVGASRRG